MAHEITLVECQQHSRVAEGCMHLTRYVQEKCSDLTLIEYQAVLLGLLTDVNNSILKEEVKEAIALEESSDG